MRQGEVGETGEERFRLVGECYLHGIMTGEAFGEGVVEDVTMY